MKLARKETDSWGRAATIQLVDGPKSSSIHPAGGIGVCPVSGSRQGKVRYSTGTGGEGKVPWCSCCCHACRIHANSRRSTASGRARDAKGGSQGLVVAQGLHAPGCWMVESGTTTTLGYLAVHSDSHAIHWGWCMAAGDRNFRSVGDNWHQGRLFALQPGRKALFPRMYEPIYGPIIYGTCGQCRCLHCQMGHLRRPALQRNAQGVTWPSPR